MKNRVIILLLLTFLLIGCSKETSTKDKYFVSILPQKYFVERVVGDLFDIEVLVKPGESPATYEPTIEQMIQLNKSKALFTIGVAFEENLLPKLRQQYPGLNLVSTDKNIQKIRPMTFVDIFTQEGLDKHNHKHEKLADSHHQHHQGRYDPHIWLSPILVKEQAEIITQYFVTAYPKYADLFRENSDKFKQELDLVSQEIEEIFSHINSKDFLCFHPAWGYFAQQFNLKQLPIEIEGKEPTPYEQKEIIRYAQDKGIKVIFVQTQFDQKVANSIAQQIDGSVVKIDPLAEDYLINIKKIANKLAESMKL